MSQFLFNIQEDYKYSIFKQCRGEPIKCGQEEGSDESAENVPPSGCIISNDRDKIRNRIGGNLEFTRYLEIFDHVELVQGQDLGIVSFFGEIKKFELLGKNF